MKVPASLLAGLLAIVAASGVAHAEGACGPFGDSAATVNQGWFARSISKHNPICFGGTIAGPWKDSDGTDRYACLYEPEQASKDHPLPLVIFLHGSLATADSIKVTGLTGLIEKADLGGKTAGFVLLAPEGRFTRHFYAGIDSNALGWDNWYRQLNPSGDVTVGGTVYKENVDAAAIDHFVAQEVASGKIDTRRIYVMGWSNGAAMALLYALNRPWIAAAAVYSAPDPFAAFTDLCTQTPVTTSPSGLGQVQVFNPRVALMHVRNDCDIGGICPNGDKFAGQVRAVGNQIDDVILDPSGVKVGSCDNTCGTDPMGNGQLGTSGGLRGLVHHMGWPSAWNSNMLDFLKQHPLGVGQSGHDQAKNAPE